MPIGYRPVPMAAGNGQVDGPVVQARILAATCSSYTAGEDPPDVFAAALVDCLEMLEVLCVEIERLRSG